MTEPGGSENRGAQRRLGRAEVRRKPRFAAVGRFPAAALVLAALGLWLASASWAQTAEVYPAVLRQVPVQSPGASSYWQQLRLTLEQADAASDAAIAIDLPPGVTIDDRDGDGAAYDEIRVVYQPRAAESPDFSASTATTTARIVLKSRAPAAAGGRVYVQFPISIGISHSFTSTQYGAVRFDDSREQDLLGADQLPELTLVDVGEFALFGSLDLLVLDPVVAPGPDTTTSAVGTAFPGEPQVLVLSLPDLVFDGGPGRPNRQVGWGDGDDSNDTVYRFYFSTNPSLVRIDSTAVQARRLDGSPYVEREGAGESVQLLTSGLPEGTHYLYAASAVTGDLALARSRAIAVQHDPAVLSFGELGAPVTFDSGGLYDLRGEANGQGPRRLLFSVEAVDHDDEAAIHLFYSANPNLTAADIEIAAGSVSLRHSEAITPAVGLDEESRAYEWRIAEEPVVPPGEYYVYAAAVAAEAADLARTDHSVTVWHTPFLRLDPVDDSVVGADEPATIGTGGARPQRFLSLTWSRRGPGGDADADDNAEIALYFSDTDSFEVPGGVEALEAAAASAEGHTRLIAAGLREDPDGRYDNQFAWDLWAAADSGAPVPREDQTYYVYGVIADSSHRRLVQMNGGRHSDAGSRLRFAHAPTVRPVQPLVDVTVDAGLSGRVSWEDMDLDDDARIRVVLSAENHGEMATYDLVTSGTDFVVNSADGRAQAEVNGMYDLREDSPTDYIDVRPEHLVRSINGEGRPQAGDYFVYIAIEDGPAFGAQTLAWRTRGRMRLSSPATATATHTFSLAPQVFTVGTGSGRQRLDLLVHDGGQATDLVLAALSVDGNRFTVADQDTALVGLQPFAVGSAFSSAKLVTNRAETADDGTVYLILEYFDPTVEAIEGLDGLQPLASFELRAGTLEGSSTVMLASDVAAGYISRLERDGAIAVPGNAGVLATGNLLPGRASLSGRLALEGRLDRSATVDVDLRPWGDYRPLDDSTFAAANDVDPARDGIQVQLDSDGSFELSEAPTGRLDLYAHLDGYLDAWTPGLDLYPNQLVSNLSPTSTGASGDSLMLGGDVAGYTGATGGSRPDNEITLADWDFVASLFDRPMAADNDSARADINGDGTVNIRDLSLVGANYRLQGPLPVYRPVSSAGAAQAASVARLQLTGALSGPGASVAAGDRVEFTAGLAGTGAVRSYQLDVAFESGHWQVSSGPRHPGSAGPVLTAQRPHPWGLRCAATTIGRASTLYEPVADGEVNRGELATWQLTALVDDPAPPRLTAGLLLDAFDAPLTCSVDGRWPTAVLEPTALPAAPALHQNYPNPFNPETAIGFAVPGLGADGQGGHRVRLEVYNSLGQLVDVLLDDWRAPGYYRVTWGGLDRWGRPAASGVYFCRLTARGGAAPPLQLTRRMVLIR